LLNADIDRLKKKITSLNPENPVSIFSCTFTKYDGTLVRWEIVLTLTCFTVFEKYLLIGRDIKDYSYDGSLFKNIFENSLVGIAISRAGYTLYVNLPYLKMFGYDRASEIVGTPILNQIAPEYRKEVLERAKKKEQGEKIPTSYECAGLKKDGTIFTLHLEVTRIILPDGPASLGFFIDVTERKNSELKIKLSEEKISKAFNINPNATFIATTDEGRFIEVNDSFCNMSGYTREDVIGKTSVEIGYWYDGENRFQFIEDMKNDKLIKCIQMKFKTKSGEICAGLLSADKLIINNEPCILSTFVDITDKLEFKQKITRLDCLNMLGELAAGIGHEIRNPMTYNTRVSATYKIWENRVRE